MLQKTNKLRLLVDKKISHLRSFVGSINHLVSVSYFEEVKEVRKKISSSQALFISSSCQLSLSDFKDSAVSFIGSPTSGTNHIPGELFQDKKITIASASGMNRAAVTDYVLAVVFKYSFKNCIKLDALTIGIIGFGAIGKSLTKKLAEFSIKTIAYDPFITEHSGEKKLIAMRKAHIISFHVPLSFNGRHPTFQIVDEKYFKKILKTKKKIPLIINTSRGHIFNTKALIAGIMEEKFDYVFDVWPDEPYLDDFLLRRSWLASPHIAGYSSRSKFLSSEKIFLDFLTHFKILPKRVEGYNAHFSKPLTLSNKKLSLKKTFFVNETSNTFILEWVLEKILDLERTSRLLKKSQGLKKLDKKNLFRSLRKKYLTRQEFSQIVIESCENLNEDLICYLKKLGMRVEIGAK